MAVNLHTKYDKKIATAFKLESLVDGRLSDEYSFVGNATVKVSTPTTVPLNDYVRTGANRYGNPTEMQDTVQELTMTQDKSFSITIDKGNQQDQNGIKPAGRMLALEIKEQAVPLKDKYTLEQLVAKAGTVKTDVAITKANVVERIATGTELLDDNEVPADGRTIWVTAAVYKHLRLSPEFLGNESLGKKALAKGQVGEFDGMTVIKTPKSRMPDKINFIIAHRNSATAPVKLNDTKIHQDPPGISGNLLEGRFRYDCFVLDVKKMGIYADKTTTP